MNPFSICIIAKNEEKKIDRCLSAASKLDAEIVLVDTGSTDKTKEIAAKYTDKIFDFEWCNDFSAARNFSISKATYDWILVLDCDEYVESFDIKEIKDFITPMFHNYVATILRRNQLNDVDVYMEDHVERFFHRKYYHYEGIIHEQVRRIDGKEDQKCVISITVCHDGYIGTPEDLRNKSLRNETLLLEALKTSPDNPYIYHQLGQSASQAKRYEDAYQYYRKGLSYDVDPKLPYVQLMTLAYGDVLLKTKRYEEALCFEGIYEAFATTADFVCLMGLIYIKNNQPLKALLEFMKALTIKEHWRDDTNNNFPRYHIGLIYEAMGNTQDAIKFFKSCTNYTPAIEKLKSYNTD